MVKYHYEQPNEKAGSPGISHEHFGPQGQDIHFGLAHGHTGAFEPL